MITISNKRSSTILAWALASIVLCAWPINSGRTQSADKPQSTDPQVSQTYRLTFGDKIAVSVFGQPDLSGEPIVDQSGNIRLPMIGDISAANLTLSELEGSISHALAQGYVRNPVVSTKIAEFSPIYVVGMVRTPGAYAYREFLSVLATIARAGCIGSAEAQQTTLLGYFMQAEERVRVLDVSRAALLMKRGRLAALQNGDDHIDFPDLPGPAGAPNRVTPTPNG